MSFWSVSYLLLACFLVALCAFDVSSDLRIMDAADSKDAIGLLHTMYHHFLDHIRDALQNATFPVPQP